MRDFFNVAFDVFLDVDPERRKKSLAILYATIWIVIAWGLGRHRLMAAASQELYIVCQFLCFQGRGHSAVGSSLRVVRVVVRWASWRKWLQEVALEWLKPIKLRPYSLLPGSSFAVHNSSSSSKLSVCSTLSSGPHLQELESQIPRSALSFDVSILSSIDNSSRHVISLSKIFNQLL